MSPPPLGTPEHWLLLAADAKRIAEDMTDASSKRAMLLIAAGYEIMAKHAAWRARLPTAPTMTDPQD